MKSSDRAILMGVGVVAMLAAFWFMIISPKREEAGKLATEITELESEIADSESTIGLAVDARDGYRGHYRDLLVLGKAAPADADTPSLLTQLQGMADRAKVDFGTLELEAGSADVAAVTPAPDPAPEGSIDPSSTDTAAAPATEAATALLPLGASVGPAGLPTMPYNLEITGGFFQTASFLAQLDSLVHHNDGKFEIDGRLFTVNGFTMTSPSTAGGDDSVLEITLSLTTYLVPESQGVTGGATPEAPAPVTAPETSTASTPVEPAS